MKIKNRIDKISNKFYSQTKIFKFKFRSIGIVKLFILIGSFLVFSQNNLCANGFSCFYAKNTKSGYLGEYNDFYYEARSSSMGFGYYKSFVIVYKNKPLKSYDISANTSATGGYDKKPLDYRFGQCSGKNDCCDHVINQTNPTGFHQVLYLQGGYFVSLKMNGNNLHLVMDVSYFRGTPQLHESFWKWDKNKFVKISERVYAPYYENIKTTLAKVKLGKLKEAKKQARTITGIDDKYEFPAELFFTYAQEIHKAALKEYKKKHYKKAMEMTDDFLFTPFFAENRRFEKPSKDDGVFICINFSAHCDSEYYFFPRTKKLTSILNDLAFFLDEGGKSEKAVYILEQIVKLNPERIVAHLNLADAYWKLKQAELQKKAKLFYQNYHDRMIQKGKKAKIPKRVYERL